jgi:hypothetical protein
MAGNDHDAEVSERQAHAEATYKRLFGPRAVTGVRPTRIPS